MIEEIIEELKSSFEGAQTRLARDLTRIRTGRANPSMLEGIKIDYYGMPTPLTQLATVKVPEPRMITITPWEKTLLGAIEKAIFGSDLGLTPNNDGAMIRLSFPPLTGERRQELAKQARKLGEDAKIAVRNARRDANDMIKALQKDGDISEDEMHRHTERVQQFTDKAVTAVDDVVARKEAEIMEV
jgi:ribosome recycling factor